MTTETRREVIAIAAVAANGVIGADGDIPWRIPEDWARFKRLTSGHVLIMGRKTYVSIGRPLPGRHTVVLTRDPQWRPEGSSASVEVVTDLDQALDLAVATDPAGPTWIAGGEEIYRLAWPRLTALEITTVDQRPAGTARFPEVDDQVWQQSERTDRDGYSFVSFVRRAGREPSGR